MNPSWTFHTPASIGGRERGANTGARVAAAIGSPSVNSSSDLCFGTDMDLVSAIPNGPLFTSPRFVSTL